MSPLWRFVRKLFGKPKGRHAMGMASAPEPFAAVPEPAPLLEPTPEPEPVWLPAVEPTPVVGPTSEPEPVWLPAVEPTPVVAAAPASAPISDLGPVRLIFSDGTIAPLPAGSPEELRARYLAQRVLEATARR